MSHFSEHIPHGTEYKKHKDLNAAPTESLSFVRFRHLLDHRIVLTIPRPVCYLQSVPLS